MSIYEFGDFRFDLTDCCLSRAGRFLQLPRKPCEVLAMLVQQPGRLITKEELMAAVWPNIAVEDNNLTVSMSKIRKVLGENKRRPKYIVTLSNRGYRFIAKVKCLPKFDAILVLPFTTHRSVGNAKFLAESVTETLVYQLTTLSNLRIIPPSSLVQYKEHPLDLQNVAKKFRVQYVLSGRLTLEGKNLRISIELVDIHRNELLWGHRYQATADDVGIIQTKIAEEVHDRLRTRFARPQACPAFKTISAVAGLFHSV